MRKTALPFEILRSQPLFVFWLATLTQAALWVTTPALFYSAPPGDVAEVIAFGHLFKARADFGPPLAAWAADIAFTLSGRSLLGIYALSQICVIVTYWAVFALGRATIGDRPATLAVLAMTGISAFTITTPEFGPAMLAMPLWALALLHFWRALAGDEPPFRGLYWYALAIDLGLLLLTTTLAPILVGLIAVFLVASERGRQCLRKPECWIAAAVVLVASVPSWFALAQTREQLLAHVASLRQVNTINDNLLRWLSLFGVIVAAHGGLALMAVIAGHWVKPHRPDITVVLGKPAGLFVRRYIYYFAIMPALAATALAVIFGHSGEVNAAPLTVLSGLAVLLAAGHRVVLHRQHLLCLTWLGLLFVPPALAGAAVILLPLTLGAELQVSQPMSDMGRFFSESFEHRTGKPLTIVAGDTRLAALVALGSPQRPRIAAAHDAGWATTVPANQIAEQGAIVVWRATDHAGAPPADIKARFPDLVPELPRVFERPVEGRTSPLRIGWALIRPQPQATKP